MSSSTLDADGGNDRVLRKGHGTGALGPSDSTDSGSDIVGGPGLGIAADDLGLDRGTNEDSNVGHGGSDSTAGADVGDVELDSDSDRWGTGEHAGAGRDNLVLDRDRGYDRIEGPGDDNVWGEIDDQRDTEASALSTDAIDAEADDEDLEDLGDAVGAQDGETAGSDRGAGRAPQAAQTPRASPGDRRRG